MLYYFNTIMLISLEDIIRIEIFETERKTVQVENRTQNFWLKLSMLQLSYLGRQTADTTHSENLLAMAPRLSCRLESRSE